MVVASVASSDTEPAVASTSAARMMASTELFVSFVATAPAPVSATELLLELIVTLADAATTSASMSLDDEAVRLTSPLVAVLSTPSMTASVVLVISFKATATATPPAKALPSLLNAKFTCADTASARMTPLSVALSVRSPPAVTVLAVPGTESSIAARVVLSMVLVVTATFALRLAAAPSLDCEMVSETPNAVASIEPVLEAVTETSPPAATVESSMTASAELVISLIAIAMPRPMPTLVPLSTLIDAVTAPAVAVIAAASVAETATFPLASTTLGSMVAVVVEVMKLPEPEPAPARARLPLVLNAPAMPSVNASIAPLEVAVTLTLPMAGLMALTFFSSAVVDLLTLFSAAAAPAAMAPTSPELPELPPVETASAPEPASALMMLESVAVTATSPAIDKLFTPPGLRTPAVVVERM